MKRFLLLTAYCLLFTSSLYAQQGWLKGVVKDATTGETLIGANVVYAEGKGLITDLDGKFSVQLSDGEYTVKVSYVGYQEQEKKITIKGNTVLLDFVLNTVQLREVEVVADIAKTRETPVAFSNISPIKIQEQLGAQDLPMILNTTPGVYATQQGGGDGEARINIRGFNQRNVAVMIDGVPQNDMENGWVYWSNWFGLDNITRSLQVQRGLGASKLAIPSVGGTMNIITKGIDAKKGIILKQEYGSNNSLRTSIALTSGKLKNGFGITAAGSFKQSDGWVDETWSKMWFYYLKVEKKWGKHLVSLSGFGGPQSHGQRTFKNPVATYDKNYAAELGVDTTGYPGYGLRYNEHWGYVTRYREGDSLSAKPEVLNERINFFHKPVIMLKDFWSVSERFYVSAILYASYGNGGGTSYQGSQLLLDENGQYNFQSVYNANAYNPFNLYQGERRSTGIIRASYNNHQWYGGLATFNYEIKNFNISGGVDMRSYIGNHYTTVYDLIGGDLFLDYTDKNQSTPVKRKGDFIGRHFDGKVKWGGLFAMLEFKKGRWSAFINLSGAYSGYQRIDYFQKKDLVLADTTLNRALGFADTLVYNGITYTNSSSEAEYSKTDQKWFPGYTVKGGANFNITESQNIFFNLGYLNRAPRFTNVFDNNNQLIRGTENEIVKAIEVGYTLTRSRLAVNFNAYYTVWNNRPVDYSVIVQIDGDNYSVNINGMDARHTGVELDFAWKALQNLTFEGMSSLGNWIWTSKEDSAVIYDDSGIPVGAINFDANGVRVSDAAQFTLGASGRYEPVKGLYIKPQYNYFGQNYSLFEPTLLKGSTAGKQSWKIPDYGLLELHLGYGFNWQKVRFDVRGSILNLLNTVYISDAQNNQFSNANNSFDATAAGVFVGMGRRYNTSLTITF